MARKQQTLQSEIRLMGIPISPGVAVARACLSNDTRHARLTPVKVAEAEKDREMTRLYQAFLEAGSRLADIQKRVSTELGPAEGEIFVAQKMMVDDESLRSRMMAAIRDDAAGAEMAVMSVMDVYEARISALDNEYLRERATDVGEVKRRLLDVLAKTRPGLACEGRHNCQKGRGRIVVGTELTPSLTIELDAERLRGLVTEHGGVTSHAAILARALGIPAVSGIRGLYGMVTCGTELVVNGNTGEVIIWPAPQTVAQLRRPATGTRETTPEDPVPALRVMANISVSAEVTHAVRMRAEGVGLYRTEFEFMTAGRVLSEDEQFERYATVVKAMRGQQVYVRLLDIGGDKQASYLDLPLDANPALGFRGARLLLRHPELVNAQARAVARASAFGPIGVTYPMIVDSGQFLSLKGMFAEATRDIQTGEIRHGVMFEVPSACIDAEAIFTVADFGSIGTNDLFQYLFALDRDNELVAWDYRPEHPVFWSLIGRIAKAAADCGKPLSVCGELAGMPEYAGRLIDAGIRAVSVNPHLISEVRRTVANRRQNR
jgi:phosphotransferase system enzyme I (PtsI)